ncbi:MAG: hypothetical protein ABI321_21435 [Polyangia bacterium]
MRRKLGWVLAVTLLLLGGVAIAERAWLRLGGAHVVGRPHAVASQAIEASLSRRLGAMRDLDSLQRATLAETGARLHFGLGHTTSLQFDAEREGNCIEYAQLFSTLFDAAAVKRGMPARAYPIHSPRVTVSGLVVPLRGWHDHDWVLIVDGAARRYVDPTLADFGLGWDVEQQVVAPGSIRP